MQASASTQISSPAPRVLQGPNRVAALLLAMGKPAASLLLKRFDPDELKEIARAASTLGPISAADLEAVIEDFAGEFAAGMSLLGTTEEMERLLTGILPGEQISDIMADVAGRKKTSVTVWERAADVADDSFLAFLDNEHPQTVALILSKVKGDVAARILGQMSPERRSNLMLRMAALRPVTPSALLLLESGMHEALATVLDTGASSDTYVRIADILNRMEQEQTDNVLDTIGEERPDLAKILRRFIFRFEDIAKLSDKARMTVFDKVPSEQVVLALRNTDGAFRELVLSSIASRARRIVEHELSSGDEPDPKAVTDARRSITDRIMELISGGEIEFNPSENEDA